MNLILGYIEGYSKEEILPFVESLQRTNYSGDIVFITNRVNSQTLDYLRKNQIKTIQTYTLLPSFAIWDKYNKNFFFRLFVKAIIFFNKHVSLTKKLSNFLVSRIWHCQAARYFHYDQFLRNANKLYDLILLTDVRDVIFQSNPFEIQNLKHDTVTFLEHPQTTLGQQESNREWLQTCYGEVVSSEFYDLPIICSGITFGTETGIKNYLQKMKDQLNTLFANVGFDQAAHNYIIHKKILNNVEVRPYGIDVIHLALTPEFLIKFDENNNIVNSNNTPIPIVHQYDRHISIKEKVLKKFISNESKL